MGHVKRAPSITLHSGQRVRDGDEGKTGDRIRQWSPELSTNEKSPRSNKTQGQVSEKENPDMGIIRLIFVVFFLNVLQDVHSLTFYFGKCQTQVNYGSQHLNVAFSCNSREKNTTFSFYYSEEYSNSA